jgi:hypothetical protein
LHDMFAIPFAAKFVISRPIVAAVSLSMVGS